MRPPTSHKATWAAVCSVPLFLQLAGRKGLLFRPAEPKSLFHRMAVRAGVPIERQTHMAQNGDPKCRTMMLTQQTAYLGQSFDDLVKSIDGLGADRWAVIEHDMDVSEDGSKAADHVHAALSFKNPRTLSAVARKLRVKPQYIAKWDAKGGSADNAFSYLCHRTASSVGKYQYDPGKVVASFDYPTWLEEKSQQVAAVRAGRRRSVTSRVLDDVYDGVMTADEAAEELSGHEYARVARQLREVEHARHEIEAREWREANAGKLLECVWIYGESGCGKTRLAKKIAGERGDYFISGSTRDPWACYTPDKHTVILDELRPGSMSYADLLRVTDPHCIEAGATAPARYHDVPLACDLIIITTPFSPFDYWIKDVGLSAAGADKDAFGQLERRVTLSVLMNEKFVWATEFDKDLRMYKIVKGSGYPNPYIVKKAPTSAADAFDRFCK